MSDRRKAILRADLERLEARENPDGGWAGETFDQLTTPTLPAVWSNWANDGQTQYITSRLQPASGPNSLASLGSSATQSRFWAPYTFGADYGAGITVRSNASARLEVVARGANLNTATPTYVSAVSLQGGGVELVEVVNGVRRSLGKVATAQALPPGGVWLRVQLKPTGDNVGVQVQRADDGRYLTSTGGWQAAAADALKATTAVRTANGAVGVARLTGGSGMAYLDDFVLLTPPSTQESFDTTLPNPLPATWQQWSSDGIPRAGVGTSRSNSPTAALGISGGSATAARAWFATAVAADSAVDAFVFADSLIPAGVLVRGSNLNTAAPSYYSLTVVRGLTVQLKRVVNGTETTLATLPASGYVSGQWVKLTLQASGNQLRALVYRTDTKQWLGADGSWQGFPDAAFSVTDSAISGGGFAGVERARSAFGTVWIDDFQVRPASNASGPQVSVGSSQPGTVTGVVRFTATATPANQVARIEFRLDGVLRSVQSSSPAVWDLDSTSIANGEHTLTVRAIDADGNSGTAVRQFTVTNSDVGENERPNEVRRYSHIRLAQLAYAGNPMGAYEKQLAANSLDLIVPNTRFLGTLEAAAADTPKVIYSNVSNLYGDLLTDWFEYAGANGADRETAFFHVTQATAFTGVSAASVPVREFWKVLRGAADGSGSLTDLTANARGSGTVGTAFGGAGQAVHLGWPDRFREVNVTLQSPAVGWAGRIEYVAEVNADGSPKTWKTLQLLSNSTANFTSSGQLIFDPPADWKAAKMRGTSQALYYVRAVTTQGTGPTARTLYGRDYVGAAGGSSGTIPAFDDQADKNHDGYLNDAEYAARRAGLNARFVHESRLFYPYYGQMRFVTNPGGVAEQRWAADYHQRLLAQFPQADGVFLDNSNGKLPFAGTPVKESVSSFTEDLAAAVGAVRRALPGKWVVSNTAGSIAEGDPIARESHAVFEEFLLRPNDHNWSNLIDMQDRVNRRLATGSYAIIDTHAGSGSIATERTRMGALSYYYLLGDPDDTFLMFFGGSSPAAAWSSVFVPAATYNVGKPKGAMTTFASGTDPQNASLTYKVYGREYDNALTLFKPRSYTLGKGTGTSDDATATTHQLNGQYRQLYSDGSLGQVVTSVRLRNGEGVVLVKA
jgi:hypothetical protein